MSTTNFQNENNNIIFLEDGENDWKGKKQDSIEVANSFKRLALSNENYFYNFIKLNERMLSCASYLEFKLNIETEEKKLHKAFFCRARLCTMCNWRRSKKIFGQVATIVNELEKFDKYEYIFLTLTLKNCSADELENTINLLNKSFNRMNDNNKKVKKICKGYFKAVEVTYNKNENNYHPHIHCIMVVEKNYFKSKDYIKKTEWEIIWQKYLQVDYLPMVDVRKVKTANYKKAVAEVSKYTVKSKDILLRDEDGKINEKLTDKNILTLHFALKGKRLVSFGGIMKQLHKNLNLEDLNNDDIDLVNTDFEDNDELVNYIILKFRWSVGYKNYILVEE